MVKVVLDAMGGDNAPEAPVLGAIAAINKNKDVYVKLVGDKAKIEPLLQCIVFIVINHTVVRQKIFKKYKIKKL